jgi:hypothetical protein
MCVVFAAVDGRLSLHRGIPGGFLHFTAGYIFHQATHEHSQRVEALSSALRLLGALAICLSVFFLVHFTDIYEGKTRLDLFLIRFSELDQRKIRDYGSLLRIEKTDF